MYLQLEDGTIIENPTKKQIQNKIYSLINSIIVLENIDGNYIQAGGGKEEFTVEVRIYSNNDFSHWKAEGNQKESNERRIINISGSNVQITKNQVLDRDTVFALFESFYDGTLLSDIVCWGDITSMFKEG